MSLGPVLFTVHLALTHSPVLSHDSATLVPKRHPSISRGLLCLGEGFQIAIKSVYPRHQMHCAMTRLDNHGGHANADASAPIGKASTANDQPNSAGPGVAVDADDDGQFERQSGPPRQKRPIGADDAN
ncbi:hypothetical protein IWZ00DRAFT_362317 [Phyllosticta capitalensis]|uniref:Secreted protein n=1 Tax=Phyllosticta capitalensis TaxID=121624 RepID=A0ABR1YAL7_9PEZI